MMYTRIFGTSEQDLAEAAEILKRGGLVAFPTETVYGLGADALNGEAVRNVYIAKGRPSDNPMIAHIADFEDIARVTDFVSEDMKKLMKEFWPGPLTMVVPAKDCVPRVTTGGLETVAVRMPSHEVARKLIRFAETPVAAPSANLSGKPSPTKASHVIDDLDGKIDAVIEGGDCKVGIESTVVDMTADKPVILRPGIITKEELSDALGKDVEFDPALLTKPEVHRNGGLNETGDDFRPKAPGMKYKHYAPNAEMIIFKGDKSKVEDVMIELKEKRQLAGARVEIIEYDDSNPEEAARDFFAKLRAFDKLGVDLILARALPESGVGFSVMNRMLKSAGYNIVEIK